DGSTDTTPKILARFAGDPRIRVHGQRNSGVAAALNRGIQLCRAPLVARLDSDDLALPDRLRDQKRFLDEHPEIGMVGGQAEVINDSGCRIAEAQYPCGDAAIRKQMEKTTPFVHSAVTLRSAVLQTVGGYRPSFNGAEDLDLWLRIAERTKLANLPEPVVSYRLHRHQCSATKIELQAIRVLAARESARRRAAGLSDPLPSMALFDEAELLSLEVPREEIDQSVVDSAVWMAKSADRAGYRDTAEELFAVAVERARGSTRKGALRSQILRAKAQRRREQGQLLRAGALAISATLFAAHS
ncbi:MAG TPA: glycosyltransferase, partial [Solirubrobacterales bacterium]|nr:glycosyltransferase [Solirubrobacterales bacterium]